MDDLNERCICGHDRLIHDGACVEDDCDCPIFSDVDDWIADAFLRGHD